jgi:5-deoxy-glucuronate isomerase
MAREDTGHTVTELLFRARDRIAVSPAVAGWRYISFRIEHLREGERTARESIPEEIALVPLSGSARVRTSGGEWHFGGRRNVFDGLADVLYLPSWVDWTLTAESDLEVAICGAYSESRAHEPRLVSASDYPVEVRGAGGATRRVATPLAPDFDADKLIIVEVWTPAGNWSSYPPHKHDELRLPDETPLEETFYFRTPKPGGFALQRLYSPDRGFDEAWVVHDGDLLVVPWGYHTTTAAPGHDLYYLNVLAGDTREMKPYEDPEHSWIRASWAEEEQDPRAAIGGSAS